MSVTLGQLIKFSELQFPNLQNEDIKTYFMGFPMDYKNTKYINVDKALRITSGKQ